MPTSTVSSRGRPNPHCSSQTGSRVPRPVASTTRSARHRVVPVSSSTPVTRCRVAIELRLGDRTGARSRRCRSPCDAASDLPFQLRATGHVGGELVAQGACVPEHVAGGTEVDGIGPVLQDRHAGGDHVVEQTGEQPLELRAPRAISRCTCWSCGMAERFSRAFGQVVAIEHADRVVEVGQHARGTQAPRCSPR